jgi:hypothetical protein
MKPYRLGTPPLIFSEDRPMPICGVTSVVDMYQVGLLPRWATHCGVSPTSTKYILAVAQLILTRGL